VALLWLVTLLAACGPAAPPATATPAGMITRERAIELALALAAESRPEVSGALATPENVAAEAMPLRAAVARLHGSASPAAGYDPEMPVWLVTMDGLWASEATAPGVTPPPTPPLLRRFAVILDAMTGLEIESVLRP
jgi:hypothetical protein